MALSKRANTTSWIAQIVTAVILGQTLFFKFSGAEESVALFEALGAEPWGRYASGVFELIAVVLLLNRRTAALGALLGLGMMVGAIGSHLTKLGIVWHDDGGTLFILACVTFVASALVAFLRRASIPIIGKAFA